MLASIVETSETRVTTGLLLTTTSFSDSFLSKGIRGSCGTVPQMLGCSPYYLSESVTLAAPAYRSLALVESTETFQENSPAFPVSEASCHKNKYIEEDRERGCWSCGAHGDR